ncbi:glycosidase [Thermocatellispora tengchongensis]|uniref:Glycosidase n=1 Tax=Thermocatellispora tengchongensis TaxID=1073253 RepID=A0A840NPX0_9ACTN|nr:glycoside hydrolase family 13 protein [Thermocatellispora tengchongensis]MBB5130594.1 glycosidase [Thermocatellispora tengchongensis]
MGPDWVRDAVFYQIFPDRFATSGRATYVEPWGTPPTRETFCGGDLDGIASRLDHLRDLGVTALYLTPIFMARTNHRYDTTDYFRIDPVLGDEEIFARLVESAHAHGIKVVLDAVFHHCGDGHPAFQDVLRNGPASRYVNWFSFQQFEPEPAYLTCSGCHYLPKLNVTNPEVRDHLFAAAEKWTRMGIDGWRLDVPYMMDNLPFWRQFRRLVKGISPDLYIVAEVWEAATDWTRGDTSDGAMNYRLRDAILGFVTDHRLGGEWLATELDTITGEIGAEAKGLMLNLLGSHDTERVLTRCGGEPHAARFAFSLLMAAEGAPMVYYGDEIGLRGFNDPDCRRCMTWDRAEWDQETLAWLKTLIRLRRDHVALRRGVESTVQAGENVIVRARTHPDETVLVLANRGNAVEQLAVGAGTGRDLISGEQVKLRAVAVRPWEVRFVRPD